MLPDFDSHLRALAEVMVRVGVNLQPGQPLLLTEPYELQGIHPEAASLGEAIRTIASGSEVTVIMSDPLRLRALVEADDRRGFEALVRSHTRRLRQHLTRGGAFLFLLGSQPQLLHGLPAVRLAEFDRLKWRQLGPVIQRLVRGASQWTLAPAPSSAWADAAYADLPATERLPALWSAVFEALRVTGSNAGGSLPPDTASSESGPKAPPTLDPLEQWQTHLAALARHRDALNTARHRRIRYVGPGTDLILDLPRSHAWCTAQLVTKTGVPFVANLPTEEVFTAPHKASANGSLQVSRPVVHGGTVIDSLRLEFRRGRVVGFSSRTGEEALRHLLGTDDGADRIGEVAIIPALLAGPSPTGRLYHHSLLDENAAHHLALGEAYPFCSRAWVPLAVNRSQVHLDLPLDATVELS